MKDKSVTYAICNEFVVVVGVHLYFNCFISSSRFLYWTVSGVGVA